MPIAVQTPTGTVYMDLWEYLESSDEEIRGLQAPHFIDPLSVKIPVTAKDVTDKFDLPDISDIEEIEPPKQD